MIFKQTKIVQLRPDEICSFSSSPRLSGGPTPKMLVLIPEISSKIILINNELKMHGNEARELAQFFATLHSTPLCALFCVSRHSTLEPNTGIKKNHVLFISILDNENN